MNWSNNWSTPVEASVSQQFNPWDNMTRDELLTRWQQLKDAVEAAKTAEMKMRKYIVQRAFPERKEGTNKVELGNGYELKAGIKFNYNLDKNLDNVEAALDAIEKMGNEGAFIAERLINWSASLSLTEYRKLQADDATEIQKSIKKQIDKVLTITDAAPTLEIKEPKNK